MRIRCSSDRKKSTTWVTALIQTSCGPLMTCPPPQTTKVSREYLALQIIYRSSPLLRELAESPWKVTWESKALTHDPVLKFFDSQKKTVLHVMHLRVVWEHAYFKMAIQWHMHLQPSLQANHAQIEKELWSVFFGVERFEAKKGVCPNWPQTLGVCYEEESAKCTEEGEKNAVVVMEVWLGSSLQQGHRDAYCRST